MKVIEGGRWEAEVGVSVGGIKHMSGRFCCPDSLLDIGEIVESTMVLALFGECPAATKAIITGYTVEDNLFAENYNTTVDWVSTDVFHAKEGISRGNKCLIFVEEPKTERCPLAKIKEAVEGLSSLLKES